MKLLEIVQSKRSHIARFANQSGAEGEAVAISEMEQWIQRPKGSGLRVLLQALKETGITVRATSFDAISLPEGASLDFEDLVAVRAALPAMNFVEIKTANQPRVKAGFAGFFFALTEGEILAAEALGSRHRVALFNKLSGELLLSSVPEILARARSLNWQVSVQL